MTSNPAVKVEAIEDGEGGTDDLFSYVLTCEDQQIQ